MGYLVDDLGGYMMNYFNGNAANYVMGYLVNGDDGLPGD